MTWQILLTISVITGALSALLQKILMKDKNNDPIAYSIFFQILTGIFIGIYALIRGFETFDIKSVWMNFLAMCLLYGLGNTFLFKAFSTTEASKVSVLFSSRGLWSIVAAIIFLHEVFLRSQIIGTVLILASVILISIDSSFKIKFGKGEFYALIAAICFGLAFVNDAYVVQDIDVPSYLSIAFIAPGLLISVFYPKSIKEIKKLTNLSNLLRLSILSILYATSAITVFMAYQKGNNAAQIAPLQQVTTILTVIMAVVILREKSHIFKKLIAAVLSVVGIILLK